MVLQLARVHLVLGVVGRVLVQVRQEDGLGVRGLHVLAAAAVAVPAGADLVVEGAVDFVLLRAEDGGEVAGGGGRKSTLARRCGEREGGGKRGLLGHCCDGIGMWELEVLSAGEERERRKWYVQLFECWTWRFAKILAQELDGIPPCLQINAWRGSTLEHSSPRIPLTRVLSPERPLNLAPRWRPSTT